jgi:hypothetical protein
MGGADIKLERLEIDAKFYLINKGNEITCKT